MRNYIVKEESLTAIADSIRSKTGDTEELVFPDGFVEAVEGISVGEEIDPIAKIIGEDKVSMLTEVKDYEVVVNGQTYRMSRRPSASELFQKCTNLVNAPQIDISNVTSTIGMFSGCFSLLTVPLYDTSKVVETNNMFNACIALTTVPLLNTSNVTTMVSMFDKCFSLSTIPCFNMSKATTINSMFSQCYALTTIPLIDTSNASAMSYLFNKCYALTTVPALDMRKAISVGSMFQDCTSLTECWLRNIKVNLQVGSGTSWGHLLTLESLLHLIKECRDTGSTKTLTIGTANMAKLANTYVRTIDVTDEMRAEDDLIDEKLPFEVCESTDEGAMLISEYVLLKNWQLK